MANRVNKKFVIILAGTIVAACLVLAFVASYVLSRRGPELVSQGDKLFQQGEYQEAAKRYSRAVNKNPTNNEWLIKWRSALLETTPETQGEYEQSYNQYINLMNRLARNQPGDPEVQLEYLNLYDDRIRGNSIANEQGLLLLIDEIEQRLTSLEGEISLMVDGPEKQEAERGRDVIRGLRGLAGARRVDQTRVEPEEVETILEDLRVAAKAHPEDWRYPEALVRINLRQLQELELEGRALPEEISEAQQRLDQSMAVAVERFGDVPQIRIQEFLHGIQSQSRQAQSPQELRELAPIRRDQFANLLNSIHETSQQDIDYLLMLNLASLAQQIGGEQVYRNLITLLDDGLENNPDDARLFLLKGDALRRLGEFEQALATLDVVRAMERPTVSLQGLMLEQNRISALDGQIEALLNQHATTDDPAVKSEALADAKEKLEEIRAETGIVYENTVKRRTGQVALIEGDYDTAVEIFSELSTETGSNDPEIMRPLAQALIQKGNYGVARQIFDDLLATGQRDSQTLFITAELEVALRNYRRAESLIEEGLRLDPDNERAQERLATVRMAISGNTDDLRSVNPIVAAIVQARELLAAEEENAARTLLEETLANNPGNIQLIRELIQIDLSSENRDRALQRVDQALQQDPNNQDLRSMREFVANEDPLEAALSVVEQSDRGEFEKAMGRFVVYSRFGRTDEAEQAFEEAENLNPRDPRLIQIGFERSIARGGEEGLAAAERYADLAMEQNEDARAGLILQGRIELAKGNGAEAARLLSQAIEQNPYDPYARRYLGLAQRASGQIDASIESLARAFQGKPDDANISLDYATALVAVGRGDEALPVLNPEEGHLRFGGDDRRIVQLWLTLEAQFGDRERALEVREKRFEANPLNVVNAASYIDLLMQEERWSDAQTAIERIAALEDFDPLRIAQLRAVWQARQNRIDAGREVISQYIESIPDSERTVDPYLVAAEFERNADNTQAAIAWLQAGRPYQSQDVAEADRQLGDIYYNAAQQAEQILNNINQEDDPENYRDVSERRDELLAGAIEAYAEVNRLAADNADLAVTKRLAEAHMIFGNLDEAASLLSEVPENDLEGMILRASIASRNNDDRTARQILDNAVERHPNQPIAFIRRAAHNQDDPARFPDVIADLDRATTLRPDDLQAWAMLFQVRQQRGETDEAIRTLRQAIERNPQNGALKRLAVNVLRQQGRLSEALGMSADFAREQSDSTEWQARAGLLAYQLEQYRDASEFYRRLYELDPTPENAGDLLNSLLRKTPPPTRADINRLIPDVREAPDSWRLKMLLARAYTFLEDNREANRLTIEAYREAVRPYREWAEQGDQAPRIAQLSQDPQIEAAGWFSTLVSRFDEEIPDALAYIERTDALEPLPPLLRLYPIQHEVGAGGDPNQLLSRLTGMEEAATITPFAALFYHRLRNQILYAIGDFPGVVEACRAGLELAPNDVELNNNLAYTLAKHLNDAQSAIPYASIAERVAPRNAAVLDTVGWVYLEVGRLNDADRVLDRAVNYAATPQERLPALLHHGLTKIQLDDVDAAERLLRSARDNWDAVPQNVRDLYEAEMEELEQLVTQR